MGPLETSNSDAKHALVRAQNDGSCLRNIETCYSGPEVTVLHAKTTRGVLDPLKLVSLVLKLLFCMHKSTDEGWNPYKAVKLVQITLFCMHKTTGEVWDL